MTEKVIEKVLSDGKIILPKEWMDKLIIKEGSLVELELNEDELITIKKKIKKQFNKIHPLEIEDGLFAGINPFNDEELEETKRSIFPKSKFG